MVKPKTGFLKFFAGRAGPYLAWILPLLALLTFISSWAGLYPSSLVEAWYAHKLFPRMSRLAGIFADSVSIAWLDVLVPLGIVLLVLVIRRRRWRLLLNVVSGLYLIFFWGWGLNYHRQPLASRLQPDEARMKREAMDTFAARAAAELNRLYVEKQKESYD